MVICAPISPLRHHTATSWRVATFDRCLFGGGGSFKTLLHLGDKLFRVQIWLKLAELHVARRLGLSILLDGARFVVHLPGFLAEQKHIFWGFHQSFVEGFRLLFQGGQTCGQGGGVRCRRPRYITYLMPKVLTSFLYPCSFHENGST